MGIDIYHPFMLDYSPCECMQMEYSLIGNNFMSGINQTPQLAPQAFNILYSLSGRILHGYGIMKQYQDDHNADIATGTLYKHLAKLLDAGLIEECPPPSYVESKDKRRRYYKTTGLGERTLDKEIERMNRLVQGRGNTT